MLLNKADRCSEAELDRARELVSGLQPDAETVPTEFSAVDPDRVLGTGAFDRDRMRSLPAWKRLLEDADGGEAGTEHSHDEHGDHADDHAHAHPDEVYGVTSFRYRRRRPFHPERVAAVFRELPPSVVRAKGTVWIAGSDLRTTVSVAGPSVRATARGPWIASLPEVEREMYRSNRPELPWDDEHGDRRVELVFIGTDYDRAELEAALDEALVDPGSDIAAAAGAFPDEAGAETVLRE